MFRIVGWAKAALIAASMTACGAQGEDFWKQQARNDEGLDSRPIGDVLRQDLSDISDLGDIRAASSGLVGRVFGQLFEGYDGPAVRAYIDGRVKHFLTYDDMRYAQMTPDIATFKYKGWLVHSNDGPETRALPGSARASAESRVAVGAQNLGMVFWMHANINQTPLFLRVKGERIALDSPRAGVMLIGESYRASHFSEDFYYDLGPLVRQHVLVHESRHSDCTGGMSARDLALGRKVQDHDEFLAKITNIQCGHFHVACKEAPLKGILACDAHPWGSYATGLVYLLGAKASLDPYGPEAVMADASIIDTLSRLQFSYEDMLSGRLGPPDMSHSTEIVP